MNNFITETVWNYSAVQQTDHRRLWSFQRVFFIRTLICITSSRLKTVYECKSISFNDGPLGSPNDEERSEMRYVM